MTSIVVLGGTGMLGGALVDVLGRDDALEVHATARTAELVSTAQARAPRARWSLLAAGDPLDGLPRAGWVVNAIGLIKHWIDERDPAHVEQAIVVNALFPHQLARHARQTGARALQIATDCVYSGARGAYVEDDPHDALDVYGKTKSLGEVRAERFHNLRCSIVGPEEKGRRSLLEWFLGQPRGAQVNGFTNHQWNGVTTLHFARLVRGAITSGLPLPGLLHVVPAAPVSKARLLELFADAFDRRDLRITAAPAPAAVDRTIATGAPEQNAALWRAAGYDAPPTIERMVQELAAWRQEREARA